MDKIREIIVQYVETVGVVKATDESLYILSKIGHTPVEFIKLRAGALLTVIQIRVKVLEYLYGDDETMEQEMLYAAKKYLHASKRNAR